MFVAALGLFSTSYTVYGMTMKGGGGGRRACVCMLVYYFVHESSCTCGTLCVTGGVFFY